MGKINSQLLVRVAPEKCSRATRWFNKCTDCKSIDDFNTKALAIAGAQNHIYNEHDGRGAVLAGAGKRKHK